MAAHDLETGAGSGFRRTVRALVLELVEGPTLGDRIAGGSQDPPLPITEALAIAVQIAGALEAAHAQGVVHRDLKPANVKVKRDGMVKVLDFGLAKIAEDAAGLASGSADEVGHRLSLSPTMTSPAMTRMRVIMGTAAYMSPEQARGSTVDSRSDVWASGVVLYEMLAGKPIFGGATVSDTPAAVPRAEPEWSRLPPGIAPPLRRLIGRCLERDIKRRLQHIGDARIEIEGWLSGRVAGAATAVVPARRRLLAGAATAGIALVAALVAGGLTWVFRPASTGSAPRTSVVMTTPDNEPLSSLAPLALSPDGRQRVYSVGLAGTTNRVARRCRYGLFPTSTRAGGCCPGRVGGPCVGAGTAGRFSTSPRRA